MARRVARTARALTLQPLVEKPLPAYYRGPGTATHSAGAQHDEQGFQLPVKPSTGRGGEDKPLEEMRVQERSQFDTLRYQGGLRFGTALSILQTTQRIYSQLERLRCPLLLMGGAEDGVCRCGNRCFWSRLAPFSVRFRA